MDQLSSALLLRKQILDCEDEDVAVQLCIVDVSKHSWPADLLELDLLECEIV